MRAVDLSPIPPAEQTQRPFDLFLLFVGANIVATTLQVGASLPHGLSRWAAFAVVATGAIGGAALVAALAPISSRLRVPSIVAVRAVLGLSGAQALAVLLFTTNFAWIALNNVIAASLTSQLAGVGSTGAWATLLGLLATAIVAAGPRAATLVDRVAVPALLLAGVVLTIACIRAPALPWPSAPLRWPDVVTGLDMTAGYQTTWLLMFADYPRYVRSPSKAGLAVFFGLAFSALWFMPLGLVASRAAGSIDPGSMVLTLGLGWWGALLLTLATLTTNFVNIYMSALALKSLAPTLGDTAAVWTIGGVGAALGWLSQAWLDHFGGFTLLLAGVLMPVSGVVLAHYVVLAREVQVDELYDTGPRAVHGGWARAGMVAWAAGAAVFYAAQSVGGSLPSLVTSVLVYVWLARVWPTGRAISAVRRPAR